MAQPSLRVEHIAQPAVLVENLDAAIDWLAATFKAYPSERVDIRFAGVNNAVYAFGNRTYLELIEPYDPASSAHRLLQQSGPGWHMLNVDLVDADASEVDSALEQAGARIVHTNKTQHVKGAWHIHPGDTEGVLLNLANPTDHDEHGMWAGWAWREYVATNTRVVDRICGVSLVTDDLERTGSRYSELGFEFAAPFPDAADDVIEAACPAGSFLQIRSPRSNESPGFELLERRGTGLYHLCWGCNDLSATKRMLTSHGVELTERERGAWSDATRTGISVAMEYRQL